MGLSMLRRDTEFSIKNTAKAVFLENSWSCLITNLRTEIFEIGKEIEETKNTPFDTGVIMTLVTYYLPIPLLHIPYNHTPILNSLLPIIFAGNFT